MKTGILTAAVLAITGFSVQPIWAQPYSPEERGGYQPPYARDYERGSLDRERHMQMMDHWGGGMDRSEEGRGGMPGRSGGGAHFRFSQGDARIDIRCPQNKSLQNCVQAAGQLLDKIHPISTAPTPGSSAPSTMPGGGQ